MATTTHLGVSLWQKVNGGTWYLRWRDPRRDQHRRNDSSETTDYDEAKLIAMSLSRLVNHREFWEILPDGIHSQAQKIWGVRSLVGRVNQTRALLSQLQISYEFLKENPPNFKIEDDAKKWIEEALRLLKMLKEVCLERDRILEENRRMKGLIHKMGSKHLIATDPKSFKDAVRDFFNAPTGTTATGQWREILKNWIDRFGREYGDTKDIHKIEPSAVIMHISKLKVKSGTKLKLTNNLCMFLDFVTSGMFDSKAVKEAIIPNLAEQDEDWFWLTKAQALGAIAELEKMKDDNGQFWADAAMLQYACGFRAEELVLLQREKVRIEGDVAQIVITRIFDDGERVRKLKTKRSADAVQVPSFAMDALRRRMMEKAFLLLPMYDEMLLPPIMRGVRTRFETKNGLWPTADEHAFSNCYRPRLRNAVVAFDKKIEAKKIDARTMRRTCAREMILKYGFNQAAAVLRDSVETLRKHYADLQASDVSTER